MKAVEAYKYLPCIRDGIIISEATCTSTGDPDISGYRFARFRCTIVVPRLANGRLDVTPTSKTKLRWKIICRRCQALVAVAPTRRCLLLFQALKAEEDPALLFLLRERSLALLVLSCSFWRHAEFD